MFLLRFATACVLIISVTLAAAADVPAVAAAADLKFALVTVAAEFRRKTGHELKLSFGSSGNFTTQIENGAPFELFLAADEGYVFRLADRGLTRDRGLLYAIGRIVLFAPHTSSLGADERLEGLRRMIEQGSLRRFAIANPDHAPYGRAARAALQTAGLWESIQPSLVMGENAAQAAQFAASGSTDGGIIPLALSQAPQLAQRGAFAPIPAHWHASEPLRQRMVLMTHAGETAAAFYRFLQTAEARRILADAGFVIPDEEVNR